MINKIGKRRTNRIYYYCALKTAIEVIFPNRQLLLNNFGKSNDPKENKDFVFAKEYTFAGNYFLPESSDIDISREIKRDCKMLCFSTDYKHLFGYEYSRMWALYGDNHKGVCIELDLEEFIEENKDYIKENHFQEIEYWEFDISKPIEHKTVDVDRIKEIGLTDFVRNEFRPTYLDYLFFRKNKEWESEHELRLIYFSDNPDNEYCSIQNCINNIYLGIDFNPVYLSVLLHQLPGIDIYFLNYKEVRLNPAMVTRID